MWKSKKKRGENKHRPAGLDAKITRALITQPIQLWYSLVLLLSIWLQTTDPTILRCQVCRTSVGVHGNVIWLQLFILLIVI